MYRISRVDGHQRIYQTLLINYIAASEGIIKYIPTFCTSSVTVLWSDLANVVSECLFAPVSKCYQLGWLADFTTVSAITCC